MPKPSSLPIEQSLFLDLLAARGKHHAALTTGLFRRDPAHFRTLAREVLAVEDELVTCLNEHVKGRRVSFGPWSAWTEGRDLWVHRESRVCEWAYAEGHGGVALRGGIRPGKGVGL